MGSTQDVNALGTAGNPDLLRVQNQTTFASRNPFNGEIFGR